MTRIVTIRRINKCKEGEGEEGEEEREEGEEDKVEVLARRSKPSEWLLLRLAQPTKSPRPKLSSGRRLHTAREAGSRVLSSRMFPAREPRCWVRVQAT